MVNNNCEHKLKSGGKKGKKAGKRKIDGYDFGQEAKNFVGKSIKVNRIERQLSQAQLSKALSEYDHISITTSTLSKIEQGKRMVSDIEIIAFCDYFRISANQLLKMK